MLKREYYNVYCVICVLINFPLLKNDAREMGRTLIECMNKTLFACLLKSFRVDRLKTGTAPVKTLVDYETKSFIC